MKGFFAHSSNEEICETISNAIIEINLSNNIELHSWIELKIAGNFIIDTITYKIKNSELFIADLTDLNHNVLFELGYAIALNKRIVITMDTSKSKAKYNYDRLNLSSLGFIGYHNSHELRNKFNTEEPYKDLDNTIFNRLYSGYLFPPTDNSGLLYLKSLVETDASMKVSKILEKTKIKPLIVDDPKETRNQDVEWYIKYCLCSYAVIGHLLDNERIDNEFHNAKVSLCMGIAYGFDKKIIMLAHKPFNSPLDYKHLLKEHSTAYECGKFLTNWKEAIEPEYLSIQNQESKKIVEIKQNNKIKTIDIGDYIAEQESDELHNYFIDTISLDIAFKSDYSIFIGRKGTGKSALLYKLQHDMRVEKNNHVCVIKPLSYEIGGLVKIIKDIGEDSIRSYFIESIWKFLIYTELAKSIFLRIDNYPVYKELTQDEEDLLNFVERNELIILDDFWTRFDNIVHNCEGLFREKQENKLRISEYLHNTLLSKLRKILQNNISVYNKVAILIDNLDKTWKFGSDIPELSSFLLGLLSVSSQVKTDLSLSNSNFSLIIFLRSDIFTYIYRGARERDKIKYHSIVWDDPEILFQIIEERFKYSLGITNDIWKKYFPVSIDGMDTKDYIINNIIPRPRDIIFLVQLSLRNAAIHKHSKINVKDIKDAMKRYSQYAFDSLIVENGISITDFENLLYEFVGSNRIITQEELLLAIKNANIDDYSFEEIEKILCDRSFLGRKIGKNKFRYQYSYLEEKIIKSLEKKIERDEDSRYYEINIPFRTYLEIE
jgi:hypothetical protein